MPEGTDRLEVRHAEELELFALGFDFQPEGYETWTAVLIEGGEIRGHIRLSRALGQVFGHDTKSWSKDKHGALLLWRAARAKCREWGAEEVVVHFDIEQDPALIEFWKRRGFKHVMDIYKGGI